MTPGLFVLSGDETFVAQVRSRFSPRFEVVVADSLESARNRLEIPVQAALAHLNSQTLGGQSTEGFLNELQRVVDTAPIYGLVDPECPSEVEKTASKKIQECLSLPVDFEHLGRLLDNGTGISTEIISRHFTGRPCRVLRGRNCSLVTFTPSMFEMFDELRVAAAHNVTILLIGETGAGKTHLARMIHELSPNHQDRCLTVACGALPADLIESELFGYVKGAFTGADVDKPGKFTAAEAGTLLLDEIDVLSPGQQAKLLRVIETGEYEPVGSNDTLTSQARLIAASNIDLEDLVQANRFRVDLYYRLNTLSFYLPPLRERPLDVEFFARQFAVNHSRSHNIPIERIQPEFLLALSHYSWPGNIRELENVIRRAVLYCHDATLTVSDLPSSVRSTAAGPVTRRNGGNGSTSVKEKPRHSRMTLEQRIDEVENRVIAESLERHNYHRTDTARELGISRVTLYNKMKKYSMLKQ